MTALEEKPTTPSSVIQSDSFLMRTRWGNWVSDGGFIVTDEELGDDPFTVIFDAGLLPAESSTILACDNPACSTATFRMQVQGCCPSCDRLGFVIA